MAQHQVQYVNQQSAFFSLPREIRDLIYSAVFESPSHTPASIEAAGPLVAVHHSLRLPRLARMQSADSKRDQGATRTIR